MRDRSDRTAEPRRLRALAFAVALAAGWGADATAQPRPQPQGQEQVAPRPAQIDRNGVLILVRSTLLALNQANETGNYTVLRDLAAPGFRDANTAARLGEIFANQRAQRLDLSGVAVIDPQLTLLPQIEANGLMRMAGFFPSVPSQVNFELLFAPVDGRWRMFGVSVNLGSSTPAAPQPPAPASPEPPAEPPAKPEAAKPAPRPVPKPAPRRSNRPVEKPEAPADSRPAIPDDGTP